MANVSLEDVNNKIEDFKIKYPKAYDELQDIFRNGRYVGYKNIGKMILGSDFGRKSPEEIWNKFAGEQNQWDKLDNDKKSFISHCVKLFEHKRFVGRVNSNKDRLPD